MSALRHLPIVLTALLGTLVSIAVLSLSLSWERRVSTLQFEGRALDHLSVLNTDLQMANDVLETMRAYFEASERPVARAEFGRLSKVLHHRTVGLRDFGWAPRITVAERPTFEANVRASGLAGFEIRERGPDGKLVRAGERETYFPILYVDGDPTSQTIIGFDLATEPMRRAAIAQAVATGRTAATSPLKLLTVPDPRGGIMSFAPVHRRDTGDQLVISPPEGLVFGAFSISAMIEAIISAKSRLAGVDLFVFDPAGPFGDRSIVWRATPSHPMPAVAEQSLRAEPHWEGTISIIDQRWGAIFVPDDAGAAANWRWRALWPPATGIVLTVLAVAYLVVSHRRTAQLQALTMSLRHTTEDLRETGERLTHMVRHDALTGLPNRRCFTETLHRAVGRGASGEHPCAILQVDLDRFKSVNDLYGHEAGDVVLREVASRLRATARSNVTIARLGGDEFAAIVECETAATSSAEFAKRIITVLSQPIIINDDKLTVEVGASVGIALCPVNGSEPDALLRAADMAMYRTKRGGRGGYCFFKRDMDSELRQRGPAAA